MSVHVQDDREYTIRIDGYLKIAYLAPPNIVESAKELPMLWEALNAGK
jgi:hypothetical protein